MISNLLLLTSLLTNEKGRGMSSSAEKSPLAINVKLAKRELCLRLTHNPGQNPRPAKDYTNPFRLMVYDTEKEMEKVIGKLNDNTFIKQVKLEMSEFEEHLKKVIRQLKAE